MKYYFAAFGSRTQGMRFFDMTKRRGITVALINTPRGAAGLGCGISVKFCGDDFDKMREILHGGCYTAFDGFYELTNN